MKDLTPEQRTFIHKCRVARSRSELMAQEANTLGLPILAREWDFIGVCIESALANQQRAFRDGSLQDPHNPRPSGELGD